MDIYEVLALERDDDALLIKRVLDAIRLIYPHSDLSVEATESNNLLIVVKAEDGIRIIEVTETFLDAENGLYSAFRHIHDLQLELIRLGPGGVLLVTETGLRRPRQTRRAGDRVQ